MGVRRLTPYPYTVEKEELYGLEEGKDTTLERAGLAAPLSTITIHDFLGLMDFGQLRCELASGFSLAGID